MPNPVPVVAIDGLENLPNQDGSLSFSLTLKSTLKDFQVEIFKKETSTPFLNLKLNGHAGQAIVIDTFKESKSSLNFDQMYLPIEELSSALVLNFDGRAAANVNISGGKGSSLAILSRLSNKIHNQIITSDLESTKHLKSFTVPKGVIVTTNAYSLFIASSLILKEKIKAVEDSIK